MNFTMRPLMAATLMATALAVTFGASHPAAATQPQRGGNLSVDVEIFPKSLDPIFGNSALNDKLVYTQLYDSLVYQDDKGHFLPELAQSWTVAPDGDSITFKLHPGVVFHDGTPCDAAAVKFNLDRVTDPKINAFARVFLSNITSTEVIDPTTVRVNFKGSPGAMLAALTNSGGLIASPTAVQKYGADYTNHPSGTGPFAFVSWSPNDRVELKRFDRYWQHDAAGNPLPYLDRVVTRIVTNSAVKILELRSGNAQLGDTVQEKDYPTIEHDPSLELVRNPVGISEYLSFPVEKAPWTNITLRQAIATAIDPVTLNKVITGGTGTLVATFESPGSWSFDPTLKPHPYDPARAKQLFAQTGHQGPMTLIIANRDIDLKIAQVIQAQLLANLGVAVKIEVLDRQALFDEGIHQRFDLMLQRTGSPAPDPDMMYGSSYGRDASQNYAGIDDPVIVKDVADAGVAKDQAERKRLYGDIQRRLLDNYYQTYFFWRPNESVQNRNLNGVAFDYMGDWHLEKAWFTGTPPG